ncbi:MAG: FAD:protein FMN transferase [Phycisphaerae bacterium]|nr:FAD:protein FMN transferase [Phycisphaerae bacterium]
MPHAGLPGRAAILKCVLGLCAALAAAAACGCAQTYQYRQIVMGVEAELSIVAPDEPTARTAGAAAFSRLATLEQCMSDYRATSELRRLCATHDEPVAVSDDLLRVLLIAAVMHRRTRGAFDVSVGPLTLLWREARRDGVRPELRALADARRRCGADAILIDPEARTVTLTKSDMRIDLGGIGKGFAAQEAVRTLAEHGCPQSLVAIAGDIAAGDPPPRRTGWRVALEGFDVEPVVVQLVRASISTSGDAEQSLIIDGERYSHLLDPRTGMGTRSRVQATVIGPDGATVDALSSALAVQDIDGAHALTEQFPEYAARLAQQRPDGTWRIEQTVNWPSANWPSVQAASRR